MAEDDNPPPSVRDEAGRFRPGVSGNPAGKPRGARHEALKALDAIGQANAEAIMQKAIEMALDGDVTAQRILLDRIWPAARGRTVRFTLPPIRTAADAAEAAGAVLRAVSDGELTPEEGGAVAALLEAHREAILVRDLEERLRKVEGGGHGDAA